ncbi:MAG: exodeoxyribonuclease V subunit beta [Gammaproteobacteria bacterium]
MTTSAEFDIFTCDLEGISLIEASAGTGKTWTICGLYLRLLLERRLEVQQILVVTFTNAATAELRERVRSRIVETLGYLKGTSDRSEDHFVPRLVHAMEAHIASTDMAERLDLALQTFDEAAIFTIHGFCQRALADTPFSAGLPLSLDLVLDDSVLVNEAVRDFWRRHVAGDDLSAELAAFLVQKKDSPEKYARLLKRHLSKPLAKCLWPDEIDRPVAINAEELACAYSAARRMWDASREDIVKLLIASLPALNANRYKEELVQRGAADWGAFFRSGDPLAPVDLEKSKLKLYRAAFLDDHTNKSCIPPKHVFFEQAEALLEARGGIDKALELARLRLVRALWTDAGSALRARKREQRVISYDDMLFNVYERLARGECPWLAGSLRARFPAALIDEFQDTDPLQFAIFKAIYGAGDAPLFLVGDPKQAIYSFRNADLHTYLQAKQEATADYTLPENQRSTQGLIDALNGLFKGNDRAFLLPGLDYREVGLGAKIRKPFQDPTESRSDLQVWMLPRAEGDLLDKNSAKQAAVAATAAEIARLITEAGRITLDGQSLRPGDIAVLVRSHAQGREIKNALAALNIGSVELSQTSVFRTTDAEEVERVLISVLEPARDRLLRAALATELLGCDAAEIAAISNDDTRLMERIVRFTEYRETWLRLGVGFMYRRLLAAERVAERMLSRPDGERRLTNLLHLGECLHQAAEAHPSPDALLRWFQAQRREENAEEAAQLRLDSDQNLVQIVTIHKSKGLEYPIVFCPFLWEGRISYGGDAVEGLQYHDDENQAVIDLRGDFAGANEAKAIKNRIKLEESAEFLRLIYVALTRAVHRCYLVAGCYTTRSFGKKSTTESTRSLLNWLVAGQGKTPKAWFEGKLKPADIETAWSELAGRWHPHIALASLPMAVGIPVTMDRPSPEMLTVLPAPSSIPEGWRLSSYSGLSHGAVNENAASDHDARIPNAARRPAAAPAEVDTDDILRFPRGPAAGDCLHALFERIDFTDRSGWEAAINGALIAYPQSLPGIPTVQSHELRSKMLANMLDDVTQTDLPDGIRLGSIPLGRRLTELEFNLPSRGLSQAALNVALKALGYPAPRFTFGKLEGYLKGFIDLVFEHEGRYYILDWKSNHLGYTPADYSAEPVAEAMGEHGYHLQQLLYSVAVDRYLHRRLPGYRYATHFGGVLYLFVRGVRPSWKTADGAATGVYFHRPDAGSIGQLNGLLDTQAARR